MTASEYYMLARSARSEGHDDIAVWFEGRARALENRRVGMDDRAERDALLDVISAAAHLVYVADFPDEAAIAEALGELQAALEAYGLVAGVPGSA